MEKNIELAIEYAEEYFYHHTVLNDDSKNIYEYLEPSGYVDLDDFNHDKQIYLLKHQDYKEEKVYNCVYDVCFKYMDRGESAFLYMIDCNDTYAFVPNEFNRESALKNQGIVPLKMGYNCNNGIIISAKNDLRICIVIPHKIEIYCEYFLEKCKDYLSNYFEKVEIDGNDLMVNGRKVIGSVEVHRNDMRVMMFQISFVDSLKLIQTFCGVQKKTPGYIDSSIVSQEQLKNEFRSWLQ